MKIFFTLVLLTSTFFCFSQDDAKIKAAVESFNDGKYDKGIEAMKKELIESTDAKQWDLLVEMCKVRYEYTGDVAMQFGASLGIEPRTKLSSKESYLQYMDACKEAGLKSTSTRGSQILRAMFIDYTPDTLVPDEALKFFKEGEKYFLEKDFENAKKNYQEAVNLHPTFYKANIYLGDSYWYLEQIDSAIHYFQKGIKMNPTLIEPRKYLVDALGYKKENDHARRECITTFFIYPDESMFLKYRDLLKRDGKILDRHWIARQAPINGTGKEIEKTKDKTWSAYQDALKDVANYASKDGLLKENSLTKHQYLEVYSWEKMLAAQKQMPEELKFAEKMRQEGYLDCYVFISMFHYDLYPQYRAFVANNKEKITKYIETYLSGK